MAENDPKTEGEQSAPAKKAAAKPSRRGNRRASDNGGSNESTAMRSEKVRGNYASGTGWDAGQVAPSTKWLTENGEVVDSEPKGVGRVLVFEGDVVREHMADKLKG